MFHIAAVAAWLTISVVLFAPAMAVAAGAAPRVVAAAEPASMAVQPALTVSGAATAQDQPATAVSDPQYRDSGEVKPTIVAATVGDLETAAKAGDLNAVVNLATKYAHAEGVPRDLAKANRLYCHAAKYGNAEGMFQLGWAYANGRGVPHDEAVAAALFRRAADRGHQHAARMQQIIAADVAKLPACAQPSKRPVARRPPPPPLVAEELQDPQLPPAPQEIMQLVRKLAPQFEVDANLALAVIYAESAFNPKAVSTANAQGLMQLIPETAERFGVKKPFNPDENIKGGLAYLRWLLAYFQGEVPLVLAAYNAGEGAVEKHLGVPPYNETRDYVKKIVGMYRRLTHPYNSRIVAPSPVMRQIKRTM